MKNDNIEWLSETPETCDVCCGPIGSRFYDAVVFNGIWGCLCNKCFKNFGKGLGTGIGQEYTFINGSWIKTAG